MKHFWLDMMAKAVGFFFYMLLERRLGQTEAGSVLGVLANLFKKKGNQAK